VTYAIMLQAAPFLLFIDVTMIPAIQTVWWCYRWGNNRGSWRITRKIYL